LPGNSLLSLSHARHHWLAAVLGAVCLAFTVAACGGSTTSAASAPVSGGVLTYATDQVPACLDPAVSPFDVAALIDRNIYDSLVSQGDDGSIHPWLATKWTISPDGKTYTFYLRPGVEFQDGTPLNAQAAAASLAHVVAKSTASEYASSLLGPFTGTTVVNSATIEVHLSQPYQPLLQALSTPYLGIQSAKALASDSEAQLCAHPVGSGPFSFVSWVKPTSVTLKRYAAYDWGAPTAAHVGPAYLSGLTFLFDTNDASRFGSLTSGQVNVIEDVPPVDVSTLKATSSLALLSRPQPGVPYMLELNTESGPLADERVREALMRSLNLTLLVNSIYFGQYQRAWSPLSPTTIDYDPSLANSWPYDPALANKLLDAAGWTGRNAAGYRTKDGKPLVLYWPASSPRQDRADLAQGIQAEAKQVGIDIDYVNVDIGTFYQALESQKLDIFDTSFIRDDPSMLDYFYNPNRTVPLGGANEWDLNVPELTAWLNNGTASSSAAARQQDYDNIQSYLIKDAIMIPVYVPTTLDGYQASVHGLSSSSDGTTEFYGAWIAK
jgi:peptide/nickel transport system substrate-binding protein